MTVSHAEPTLIDLSQEIFDGMLVYPGHLKTSIWDHHIHEETALRFEGGFSYASKGLFLSDHGPTHVDALSHLDPAPDALSIDQMPLRTFFGPGLCIDVSHIAPRTDITAEDLEAAVGASAVPLEPDMVLLFYTGTFARCGGQPPYLSEYPGLGAEASEWIASKRVRAFGVDAPSPDNPASRTYPCHMMCRREQITHFENLANVERVLNKRFVFAGFPLRVRGGTGSPVRAVAILNDPLESV